MLRTQYRSTRLALCLVQGLLVAACGDDDEGAPAGDGDVGDGDVGDGDVGDGDVGDGDVGDGDIGDAGDGDAIPTFNGCTPADYVDRTATSAERVITIAPGNELVYEPKCMTIKVGQTVSWEGSLENHPLDHGSPTDEDIGSPNSPIEETEEGDSVEFTFDSAGTFPYYCEIHGESGGMVGSIHVEE